MNNNDYIFTKMTKEAMEELAHGNKGWKDIDTNTLFLACIGMVYNSLMHKLARPLWWAAGAIGVAAITYLVTSILSGG